MVVTQSQETLDQLITILEIDYPDGHPTDESMLALVNNGYAFVDKNEDGFYSWELIAQLQEIFDRLTKFKKHFAVVIKNDEHETWMADFVSFNEFSMNDYQLHYLNANDMYHFNGYEGDIPLVETVKAVFNFYHQGVGTELESIFDMYFLDKHNHKEYKFSGNILNGSYTIFIHDKNNELVDSGAFNNEEEFYAFLDNFLTTIVGN